MPLLWQLQVFDRAGNTIGTLSKPPGGSIYIEGSPDAFSLCIPDLRKIPAFFADPEAHMERGRLARVSKRRTDAERRIPGTEEVGQCAEPYATD